MKPSRVVIFGAGETAALAAYYLRHDSPHEVVAFAALDVDAHPRSLALGVPVIDADAVQAEFPPDEYTMLVATTDPHLGAERERAFLHARDMGYDLVSYVSTQATVWPGTPIGANCLILERVVVQPFAEVGDNVVLAPGCHIGHESIIQDHCYLAARTVVSGNVTIGQRVYLGPNTAVRNSIVVSPDTHVGAGATVLKNTQEMSSCAAPAATRVRVETDLAHGDKPT